MENNELKTIEQGASISQFANQTNFEHAQRVAKMLAASSLIPKEFQGNVQNVCIALEMANRIGASPMQVMQNLYIVHGKPSWSSSFIIAAINSCKKFSPLRFLMKGEGQARSCIAWAYDLRDNEKLEGVEVTMSMAKAEGWLGKSGSKWATMPELMLRYRAAAFFGRLYAPEILMGMHAVEEIQDIQIVSEEKPEDKERIRAMQLIEDCVTVEDLEGLNLPDGYKEALKAKAESLTHKTKSNEIQ